jgi:uncharacterized membrane protein YdfJ with MMPL/SSD domain
MALFLVPGVTALVGRAAWWPGNRRFPRADPAVDRAVGFDVDAATQQVGLPSER